ncbi:hypothetical protein BAE44_0003442 [Dichanthelium oligosanthes]|uniref:Uncharacterized protein n=2 Tax=PACMAD clade TaxID=147370 RepID=A0A1E5WDQ7_9POAL|nr:hypothetical protein BAE44_0003442 [Dichanthelium oligosanthes]
MDDDIDSSCSTPFASAPSSPGRPPAMGGFGGGGYFFSAPASPIHHLLFSTSSSASAVAGAGGRGCAGDAEFEFGGPGGPMISADELFHNGQIRPLTLPPLPDLDPGSDDDEDGGGRAPARGRDPTPRSASVHRRARSMSPLRSASPRLKLINALVPAPDLGPGPDAPGGGAREEGETAPPVTASSRSSSSSSTSSSSSAASSARGSRRWVFIKDMLLHRSKSEPGSVAHAHDGPANASAGASKPERAWPFSPSWAARDRLASRLRPSRPPPATEAAGGPGGEEARPRAQVRGRRRRSRTVAAAHERLYAAPNRAQAEEMRRRTFLPYRQGLLGCLGFSSRGYGALHGLTKTLNPVFSRRRSSIVTECSSLERVAAPLCQAAARRDSHANARPRADSPAPRCKRCTSFSPFLFPGVPAPPHITLLYIFSPKSLFSFDRNLEENPNPFSPKPPPLVTFSSCSQPQSLLLFNRHRCFPRRRYYLHAASPYPSHRLVSFKPRHTYTRRRRRGRRAGGEEEEDATVEPSYPSAWIDPANEAGAVPTPLIPSRGVVVTKPA